MKRSEYPASAFGYVSDVGRMFLHHDPLKVKDGSEHDTVDPVLLSMSLELIDTVPGLTDEQRKNTKSHLEAHAASVLYSDSESGLPIALHDKLRGYAFFKAHLDGVSEVPPVTTNGRGVAYFYLDKLTSELSWYVQYLDLSGTETASHLHTGRSGKTGDIEIPVPTGNPKQGSVVLSKEQVQDLFDGKMYFNIHSSNFPVGEIRGQIYPAAVSRSNNSLLNDNAFVLIEKDKDGKVISRKFPYKDADGNTDLVALRDSLSRLNEANKEARLVVLRCLITAAKRCLPESKFAKAQSIKVSEIISEIDEVIAEMWKHEKKEKKKDEKKEHKKKGKPMAYSSLGCHLDFRRPLVNIVVEPDQQPLSDDTVSNIQENDNSSGAPVVPGVSVSNLNDAENAQLKLIIEEFNKSNSKTNEDYSKLHNNVIKLMSESKFTGRVLVIPTDNDNTSYQVLKIEAAPRTAKSMNNLPDSAFAVIERGGKKDASGKTTPRSYRHLPYKDSSGKIDLPHLRNALARMNQVKASSPKDSTERIRRVARSVLVKAAKQHLPNSQFAQSSQFKISDMMTEIDVALCQEWMASDAIGISNSKLIEVTDIGSKKLFKVRMGKDKDNYMDMYVYVHYDGEGNATSVVFDYSTYLPTDLIDDFAKFLKQLPVKKG